MNSISFIKNDNTHFEKNQLNSKSTFSVNRY